MITTMLNRDRINSPSYDQSLLWVTLILLGIGLVMVYSASIAIAESDKALGYNSSYYLVRQTIFLIVSLTAGFIAFNVPMAWWQKNGAVFVFVGFGIVGISIDTRYWQGGGWQSPLVVIVCN